MMKPEEIKKALIDAMETASCADALEYIQQLEAENAELKKHIGGITKKVQKWISVEERLPEGRQLCIAFGRKGAHRCVDLALWRGSGTWEFAMEASFTVEYWLPLPELPKTEG